MGSNAQAERRMKIKTLEIIIAVSLLLTIVFVCDDEPNDPECEHLYTSSCTVLGCPYTMCAKCGHCSGGNNGFYYNEISEGKFIENLNQSQ